MKKFRRWIIGLLISFIVMIVLLLVFISPVCEWVIEKYSKEYIGRSVNMEDLSINLLMGTIRIQNLEISEQNGTENWLFCQEIKAGIHSGKLLGGSYVVPEVLVDGLKTTVMQVGSHFNFDDLLDLPNKYASKSSPDQKENETTIWSIYNITLRNTELRYLSPEYGIDYTASDIQISTPELAWNKPTMQFDYGFTLSTGGNFKGHYSINTKDLDYNLHLITTQLRIDAAKPYLDEFIALNEFSGRLETDLHLKGNHSKPEELKLNGSIGIHELACIDTLSDRIASIDHFTVGIDSIDIHSNYFDFGDITLDHPQLKFELYPHGDNWSRLMAPSETLASTSDSTSSYSNPFVILANYIRTYIKDYVVSDYYADHIVMNSGEITYIDYTLQDPFNCELDSMQLSIDRLNTDLDRLKMNFETRINKAGIFQTDIAINPRDYQDMECRFDFKELPSTMFNPYMNYYVATPFTAGIISFENKTTINAGMLNALNTLFVEKPKTGAKVKNDTAMKLPIKLAVSLLKNVDGNIDLEIPVEGNLNDPEYKLRKAIWSIVKNLLLKAVQAPGNLLAKMSGDKEENLQDILITYGLNGFTDDQQLAIQKMAKPLLLKPELNLILTQNTDHDEELNAMITLDARRQFATEKGFIEITSENAPLIYATCNQISLQDSVFTVWLREKSHAASTMQSSLEMCKKITDKTAIENRLLKMHQEREQELMTKFISAGIAKDRIQINQTEITSLLTGDIARFKFEIVVDENKAE